MVQLSAIIDPRRELLILTKELKARRGRIKGCLQRLYEELSPQLVVHVGLKSRREGRSLVSFNFQLCQAKEEGLFRCGWFCQGIFLLGI